MRLAAMLEQINALPGAKREAAIDQRDSQRNLCQRGLEMGGHIVRPFVVMRVEASVLRGDAGEESDDIVLYFGRGIFLDQERCRGVAAEEGEEPFGHASPVDPARDVAGEFVQPLSGSRYFQ